MSRLDKRAGQLPRGKHRRTIIRIAGVAEDIHRENGPNKHHYGIPE